MPDETPKTQTQLALERAQARVSELQAQVDAEAALASAVGDEEKALASYLHAKFCRCCTEQDARPCMMDVLSKAPQMDWLHPVSSVWLQRATALIADLPGLGWTIS